MFRVFFITAFPEMFPGSLEFSLAGAALKKQIWDYDIINIRDFGTTKHKNIDDAPFGGGCGLVIKPDVLAQAIDAALLKSPNAAIYYMSPRGVVLKQSMLHSIISVQNIIVICGRFEGVDERVIEEYGIQEISVGDFVVSGGELPALLMLDACIRLLPGVLKNQDTLLEESFSNPDKLLLEYPLYTRPAIWRDRKVPDILTSGNHGQISMWRKEKSLEITEARRPDLLKIDPKIS